MNVFITFLLPISAIISLGLKMFIVPALDNPEELFALRCETTQYGLRSIHYSGVRRSNSLPTDIRNSVSLSIFRSKIIFYQTRCPIGH